MKKVSVMMIVLLFVVTLCSCKSKEAQAVDDLILAIGEVSLESEESIIEAETAYQALTEKDQEKVENYAVLNDARKEYDRLAEEERQELVDTMFELIDNSFGTGKMEAAEGLCHELLNAEQLKLTEEETTKVNDILDSIKRVCFAGTYIVQPEYVWTVDVREIDTDHATVEELLETGIDASEFVWVNYEFDTKAKWDLAVQQYRAYLDENYSLFDTEIKEIVGTWYSYYYTDENGNQMTIIADDYYLDIDLFIYKTHFDMSVIDTSDPSLTIRDTDKVLID